MVIPYVLGGSVVVLAIRWLYVWNRNRHYNRRLEYRIRNRQDLHRL